MALVAELVTELKVRDVGFHSAMKGAAAAVGVFAAAGVGLFEVVDKMAEKIDVMAKAANKFGISLENFQALSYAAKLANVPVGVLETGMVRLSKSVDGAAQGTGPAVAAFQRLGLSAKELKGLSLDEQYLRVANALAKVGNSGDKVALTLAIFGRGGAAQLALLQSNIRKTEEEFKRLGLSITEQQANQSIVFEESKKRLETVFSGFTAQVGAQLTPAFTTIIDGITDAVTRMGDLREAAKIVASSVVGSFKFMTDGLGIFLTALDNIIDKFNSFSDSFKNTSSGVGRFLAGITGNSANYKPDTAKSSASGLGESVAQFSQLLSQGQDAIYAPLKLSTLKASNSLTDLTAAVEKAKSGLQSMIDSKNNSAISDELTRILGSDLGGKAAFTSDMQKGDPKWLTDVVRGNEAFQRSTFDSLIKEVYDQSKNGRSDDNKDTIGRLLDQARMIAESNDSGRQDNSAAFGVIKEVQKFVSEQSLGVKKPMQLNVTIQTAEGFNMKIANSPEIKAVITDGIKTLTASSASSVGK